MGNPCESARLGEHVGVDGSGLEPVRLDAPPLTLDPEDVVLVLAPVLPQHLVADVDLDEGVVTLDAPAGLLDDDFITA